MSNSELDLIKAELESIKKKMHDFLVRSYEHSNYSSPETTTAETMKYLDSIIDKMIKRQAIKVEFLKGASATWYTELFSLFSKWISKESKMCNLLSNKLIIDETLGDSKDDSTET